MLIRYGYEMTLSGAQPTALVCLLSVHDDHANAIRVPEPAFTTPIIPTTTYHDLYGNRCRRMVTPVGDLTLGGDATIEDSGKPEAAVVGAREVAPADLPDECLVYLMGSRYCETDRLSQAAWDMFGTLAPGWGRVQAVCDFVHQHIKFDYLQASSTRTAYEVFNEGVGVCRDSLISRSLSAVVSTSRLATSMAISETSACLSSTNGLQRLDRSFPEWTLVCL
jgi:hypothetical protein